MSLVSGVDFGRHNDPTVLCTLDISNKPWRLVQFTSLIKRSWDFHISQLISQFSKTQRILADATGVGDALFERLPDCWGCVMVARVGYPKYRPPNRIIVSVDFLMTNLMEQLRNRNIAVACKAPDLQQQLLRFRVKVGKTGTLKYGGAKNYHDDAVFALALAALCATLPGRPCEVFTTGVPYGEAQEASRNQ